MTMYMYRNFTPFAVFVICTAILSTCRASVVSLSENPSTLPTSSARLFFWERCEDQWNNDKGITENCCKGNYKCSSDICKDNAICKFALFGNALWCYHSKCTPKEKNVDENDDRDNEEEEEEPQPSSEPPDYEDDGNSDGNGDNNDQPIDGNQSGSEEEEVESPTPTPFPSVSPSSSASAVPTPSPAVIDDNNMFHCNGRRNRREIRDMTPEQRRQWREAIIAMRADRDENGDSEWDRLVQIHIDFIDEAHGGSFFLPWHRLLLLRLENALRKYQPDLALPYWDWAQDAADAAMSPVWNEGFAGGAQRGNMPIQSGAFRNMDARRPFGHIVRRDFTSGQSGEIPLLWSIGPLSQLVREEAWADFADGVEAAHALPHIYIGGDMSDAFQAPNDPIFYLHHTFVDGLWAERQGLIDRNQFGGTHDFAWGSQEVQPDWVFQAFGLPARAAFNLECVHYVPSSRTGRNAGSRGVDGGHRGNPSANDPCADVSEKTISHERCRRGMKILESES